MGLDCTPPAGFDPEAFRRRISEWGKTLYRPMPWRYCDDPYGVLISEVMLQQTQVSRVMSRWPRFLAKFPTVDALAAADNASVLEEWQGMGYNRRALNLKRAAECCSVQWGGAFPAETAMLRTFPGVGPSTAAGVRAFAFDLPAVYIETNVRSVFIHELFPEERKVSDKTLYPYVAAACPEQDVRGWYYALLDAGAALKSELGTSANPSRRSASYSKQSAFEGSHRQKRSALLRLVLGNPGISVWDAAELLGTELRAAGQPAPAPEEVLGLAEELENEGFFRRIEDLLVP